MKHNNQIDLQTKNVDSKGRIVLGKQFANRTTIVQYMDDIAHFPTVFLITAISTSA